MGKPSITLLISQLDKERLVRAAKQDKRTLGSFILASALRRAEAVEAGVAVAATANSDFNSPKRQTLVSFSSPEEKDQLTKAARKEIRTLVNFLKISALVRADELLRE